MAVLDSGDKNQESAEDNGLESGGQQGRTIDTFRFCKFQAFGVTRARGVSDCGVKVWRVNGGTRNG
jgi:hypothetical protein